MTHKTLVEEIAKLPVAERLEIVEQVLQGIRQRVQQEEQEDAEDVRIARERLARLASGETRTYPAEEVWAEFEPAE